jgi:PucR family transcriptional regulator, purine catabolism regulatory protein
MVVSVRQILDLPELAHGQPQVLAGSARLDSAVRWVHVSELPDIASLLQGGELIRTTGIALPQGTAGLARYVQELAAASVSGVVIELGRRYEQAPAALVEAAQLHQLPLIVLGREVQFVRITEVVHGLIIDAQVRQLQDTEAVHRSFTELSVDGAPPERIVARMSKLSGRPVVMENLAHQVLTFAPAGMAPEDLLCQWESRSRLAPLRERVEVLTLGDPRGVPGGSGPPVCWLATTIGARGEHWGRLLMHLDADPSPLLVTVLERGASALALDHFMDAENASAELRAHGDLIADIVSGAYGEPSEVHLRAQILGVQLDGRRLLAAVAGARERHSPVEPALQTRNAAAAASAAVKAIEHHGVSALVGTTGDHELCLVLALPPTADEQDVLEQLGHSFHAALEGLVPRTPLVLAVGAAVEELTDLRRSLSEAEQVARAAPGLVGGKPFYRRADLRLRALLHLHGDDPELQGFVERELSALLLHDARHGTDLVRSLHAYLEHGRNKSLGADSLGMSRPAFYQRLQRIERILDVDLDDVEVCLGLHVAVLALEVIRTRSPMPELAEPRGNGRARSRSTR